MFKQNVGSLDFLRTACAEDEVEGFTVPSGLLISHIKGI